MKQLICVIICFIFVTALRGSLCALTRDEIISTAQNYANVPWDCHKWNIEGATSESLIDRRPNWPFSAGNGYKGVPYVYGGKDSTATFKAHIAIPTTGYNYIAGKADDEIEKLYKPTIAGYAGLDCSGLVSYAYNQGGRAWSTATLPDSFIQIQDNTSISKGDVLSWAGYHCMLYEDGDIDSSINAYHAVTFAFGHQEFVQRVIHDRGIISHDGGSYVLLKCESAKKNGQLNTELRIFQAFTASPVFLNNVYPANQITIDPENSQIIPIGIYIASKKGITDIKNVEGSINGVPGSIAFKRLAGDSETVLVTYTPTVEFHQGTYYFNITATNSIGFSKSTCYAFDVVEKINDSNEADKDHDRMNDTWEEQYFGDTSQPWNGDYDGDGYTNLDEFLMGTDPTDANSPPKKQSKDNTDWRGPEYPQRGGPKKEATKTQNIILARDPNSMEGPSGSITPGQQLTYTVSFENIGEGIAYGVYVTDKFDPGIDDTSVQVSNCRRVDYAGGIETPATFTHSYDPHTRLLSVFVDNEGEVGSKQGGKFDITVRAKPSLPEGTVISNYATVYFPSVPEETPTNTIVSVIPKTTEVVYTGKTVVEYSDTLEITTALSDTGDNAIANQPVTFIVGDSSCTQTTSVNGSAYTPFDTRDILPGDYAVQTVYPGDGCYFAPSRSASALKVLKKRCLMTRPDCALDISSSTEVTIGLTDTYNRELLHQGDEPKMVYLEYRDSDTWKTLAQTSLSASSAAFTFDFPEKPHQLVYALRARFDGDSRYAAVTSMGQMRCIDEIPPDIEISSPIAGGQYGAAMRHIPIQFSVTDNLDPAPAHAAFLVNLAQGTSVQVYAGQVLDSIAIDTGTWIMAVQATDWAGNISTAAISGFEVVHATNPPVLVVPSDITAEATGSETTVVIGTATATSLFPVIITNDAPERFCMGVTTVTWTATDAYNISSSATQRITVVDTTPPQVIVQSPVEGSRFIAGISTVTVTFTVHDADPNPSVLAYLNSVGGTGAMPVSDGQVIDPSAMETGPWALHVSAHDWADNVSTATSGFFEVVRDTTPPQTAIIIDDLTMILSASDDLSGVSQTFFRIDAGSWMPYASSETLTPSTTVIEYYSVDRMGNQEPVQARVLKTHMEKPMVIETYPSDGGLLNLKTHDSVVIRFSTPVICADWLSNVLISEEKNRPHKDFMIVYDSDTCSLFVSGKFKNNSFYTITLSSGITDESHSGLDEYAFSFKVLMNSKMGGMVEDTATGLKISVPPDALPCDGCFELVVLQGVSMPKLPKPYEWLHEDSFVYQILYRDEKGRLCEQDLNLPFQAVFPVLERKDRPLPLHGEQQVTVNNMKMYQVGMTQDAIRFGQRLTAGLGPDSASGSNAMAKAILLTGQSADEVQRAITAEISSFGMFSMAGFTAPAVSLQDLSCYPSPFKPPHQRVTIQYYLADDSAVSIAVYDLLGNLVKTWQLPEGTAGAARGINQLSWDGRNGRGDVVANGGYIVLVAADNRSERFKLLVIK